MTQYEYRCQDCQETFTAGWMRPTDPPVCERCLSAAEAATADRDLELAGASR